MSQVPYPFKQPFKWLCALVLLGVTAAPLPVFAQRELPPEECPQPRFTGKAPDNYYRLQNPLQPGKVTLNAGRKLYEKGSRPDCAACHGKKGDGRGVMAYMFDPPPRNFACAETINGIPDGQLFWITKYGSPGTGMPDHKNLSDEQLWQLVLYLRHLSR